MTKVVYKKPELLNHIADGIKNYLVSENKQYGIITITAVIHNCQLTCVNISDEDKYKIQ